MKLPRDIGGKDLADLLSKYGYEINRQTGSHLRLRSAAGEGVHKQRGQVLFFDIDDGRMMHGPTVAYPV